MFSFSGGKKSSCSGRYEIFKSCGTACPETCKDGVKQNSDKTCELPCEAGCFCREGYVRKSRRRKSPCIFAKQCPPIAKVSE
jgi:hypothetical protein